MSNLKVERQDKHNGKSARLSKVAAARAGEAADITSVDPRVIGMCVMSVVRAGAAIMFSQTSDGGAISITLFDNNERTKEYLHRGDEIEQYLTGLIEIFGE